MLVLLHLLVLFWMSRPVSDEFQEGLSDSGPPTLCVAATLPRSRFVPVSRISSRSPSVRPVGFLVRELELTPSSFRHWAVRGLCHKWTCQQLTNHNNVSTELDLRRSSAQNDSSSLPSWWCVVSVWRSAHSVEQVCSVWFLLNLL